MALKNMDSRRFAERVAAAAAHTEKWKHHTLRPISPIFGTGCVEVDGQNSVMLTSYSYLGLIGHPRIQAAAKAAVDEYGTGTHGARLTAGTLPVHQRLERMLARFKRTEDALTFTSGFVTNSTVVPAIVAEGDYVVADRKNHASLVDGCVSSRAKLITYPHNDMAALELRLKRIPRDATILLIADAVFSMDGDILRLPEFLALARKYGALVMIDEAHSLGVLGETGRGIEEHFGIYDGIDFKMGTLSKTIPSTGGYIAATTELADYLRTQSRGFVFSSAPSPAQAAAALASLEVIQDEPWRVERLRESTQYMRRELQRLGFDTGHSETPIIPIMCGDDDRAYSMAMQCDQMGVFVMPIVFPVVPRGTARLRVCVTVDHSPEELDRALRVLAAVGRSQGLIARPAMSVPLARANRRVEQVRMER